MHFNNKGGVSEAILALQVVSGQLGLLKELVCEAPPHLTACLVQLL